MLRAALSDAVYWRETVSRPPIDEILSQLASRAGLFGELGPRN
jgi:hypothetical protein